MKRKLMAMFLVLCMVLTVLPVAALAEEANAELTVVPMEELIEAQPMEQAEEEQMMLLTAAEPAEEAVAKIGDTTFTSLKEAVNRAKENETVVLLKDQTLNDVIKIRKSMTIDGQGHTITGRLEVVCDRDSCNVTFKNMTVSYTADNNPTIYTWGANAVLNIEADCTVEHTGNSSAIYVVEGTLNTAGHITLKDSMQSAISSGGRNPNANIIVNGGTIEGPGGILVGQRANCVVNNGTIRGESHAVLGWCNGITDKNIVPEITINGGELHATDTALKVEDGTATVTDGTLKGAVGMEVSGDASVGTIAGGKVEAEVPVKVTTNGAKASISGGTFTNKPEDKFFADGKAPAQNEDGSYGVADAAPEQIEAAKKVAEMIENLPAVENVTLADAAKINEAKAAYDKLEKKELVNNELTKKLNDALAKLDELNNAAEADKRAAKRVEDMINALPALKDLSLRNKAEVEAARNAYRALTEEQKKLVSADALLKLEAAEKAISWLDQFSSNITVKNSLHGWVSVSHTYAAKGDLVTITVHPDKDYQLDTLSVKNFFGETIHVSGRNNVYTFVMPGTSVTVEATFKPVGQVDFYDVNYRDYYYDAVQWAVSKGITTGVSEYYFAPERTCTRAEAVTFLWRAAGSPRPWRNNNNFSDVNYSDYYYDAVQWAVEEGIVKGTSETTFSPNAVCDRGQIVTLLWRANGSRISTSVNPFWDVDTNDYFYDAVQWAVSNDITTGVTSGTFAPADACTRAQIVTFLYRSEM